MSAIDEQLDRLLRAESRAAGAEALREAYRTLCMHRHPDAADVLLAQWDAILERAGERREASVTTTEPA